MVVHTIQYDSIHYTGYYTDSPFGSTDSALHSARHLHITLNCVSGSLEDEPCHGNAVMLAIRPVQSLKKDPLT